MSTIKVELTENQAQHILDILNEHTRECEKQSRAATTPEHKSNLLREFADSHRTTKAYLETVKKLKFKKAEAI